MKMIKLSDELYIASNQITSIKLSHSREYIDLKMSDGSTHSCKADYGSGIYNKLKGIVNEINEAEDEK